MKRILFDIEGNGLLNEITKVHCLAASDIDTRKRRVWGPHQIADALKYLEDADQLIAHNGLTYDFPVLEKLHGFVVPFEKKLDTMVMARVLFPNLKEEDSTFNERMIFRGEPTLGKNFGRHTLRAWGVRLGKHKGDYEGPWDEWSQEMQDYCEGDIETTLALWDHLQAFMAEHPEVTDWTEVFELEHRVQLICFGVSEAGWPFDMKKAGKLHAHLSGEKARLEKELVTEFGSGKWVKEEIFVPKRDNKTKGYTKGVPFTKRTPIEFNPDSRQHLTRALLERGWQPTEFTDGGSPKLDDEIIENIAIEFPSAGNLATFMMIGKRLGQLANGKQALLNHVGTDLRIHTQYNPMGTVTSRASHFNPNLNVPNLSSPYGREFRELFYVPEDWGVEVGADMEGLEGRCLAHYLWPIDKGLFERTLLEGDIHWSNVLAMGLAEEGEERDKHSQLHTIIRESGAKTFFYAWLYGSGDEKAGRILLAVCRLAFQTNATWKHLLEKFFGSAAEAPGKAKVKKAGRGLKERFLRKLPALAKLIRRVKELVADYEALSGLDKRRIPVRSDHSALNTLLQSAGAILCKRWLVDFYDAATAAGYKHGWDGDFVILGWIHDEIQVASRNGLGDEFGRLLTITAQQAGVRFGFRVRLDSNYKIGRNWADTH